MSEHRCDACDICRARTKRVVDAFCAEMRAKLDEIKRNIADPSWRPVGEPNPYAVERDYLTADEARAFAPCVDFRIPPALLGNHRDTNRAMAEQAIGVRVPYDDIEKHREP